MAANKTQPTTASVLDYINAVAHEQRKKDALELYAIFNELLQEPAVLWGDSLIGYGSYHYKYDSGREGDFFSRDFLRVNKIFRFILCRVLSAIQNCFNSLVNTKPVLRVFISTNLQILILKFSKS